MYYKNRQTIELDSCDEAKCKKDKKFLVNMELYGTNNFNEIAKVRGFILGRKSKYSEEDLFAKALDKNYTIINYDKEDNGRIIEKGRIKLRCNIHECDFETSIIDFMKNANNCPKCDAEYRSKSRSKSTIEEAEEICCPLWS